MMESAIDGNTLRDLATRIARYQHRRHKDALSFDEVLSIALEAVWEAARDHDPKLANLETFAGVVAARRLCSEVKRELRQRVRACMRPLPRFDDEGQAFEPAGEPERSTIVPEIERPEFWERVRSMLTRRQWECVELRFRDGHSLEEIADRLGITPGGVASAISPALAKLRASLAGWSG